MNGRRIGLLLVVAFASGCLPPINPPPVAIPDRPSGGYPPEPTPDAPAQPPAGTAEIADVSTGNRAFALDLYARLRGQDGNLFFSPYSISSALAMTRAGARGDTAAQMDRAMHFPQQGDKLHSDFAALLKEINGSTQRGCQLSTANALWGQKNYGFKADFLKLTKDHYGAGLHEVDFLGAPEDARLTINAWVAQATRDKIRDLLARDMVNRDMRLVLTNAIYFKGDWARPFKKNDSRDEPFYLSGGKEASVRLMHQTEQFGYLDGGSFQALELPYIGEDLSLVVLLPRKREGLAEFEKTLSADKLADSLHGLRKQEVIVSLPKFKMTAEFLLSGALSDLGMPLAFSRAADFSGMNDDREPLFLSEVIHKSFLDVSEEGTEAAAATAVAALCGSAPGMAQPPPTPEFRADHPFVFLIRDKRTDSILFLGRLADPR